MNGSWSGPSGSWATPSAPLADAGDKKTSKEKSQKKQHQGKSISTEEKYYAVVVDSGAIIKHTGFSTLHNTATRYITTQGVIDEIRDSKARSHLESLPFELEVRDPSPEGLSKMVEFSKKTGDYASLSAVDMHILALLYDLEKEGCKSVAHIREEPKRALTGKVTALKKEGESKQNEAEVDDEDGEDKSVDAEVEGSKRMTVEDAESFFKGDIDIPDTSSELEHNDKVHESSLVKNVAPSSWASLVNPNAASAPKKVNFKVQENEVSVATEALTHNFGSMKLPKKSDETNEGSGQFSDAEDDESLSLPDADIDDEISDDDEFASIGDDFSDEECDVYILDPEEVDEKKKNKANAIDKGTGNQTNSNLVSVDEELNFEFPSLAAASTVPYEGSDDEGEIGQQGSKINLEKAEEEFETRREASLKPISKSGKLYNSFRGYKDIVKSSGVQMNQRKAEKKEDSEEAEIKAFNFANQPEKKPSEASKTMQSRVIGGAGFSGQSAEVDDDGEGWVTSAQEITSMKAMGTLDPFGGGSNTSRMTKPNENLPPKSCRAACATTDFAMQNVILQMNLELLSVDGVKVRKLKSWVTRCAACFHVYTGSENDGKRLFCERCGSSSLQRIAASVDGKTGRLKLHLKKNFKNKTRGTQFALPKPGSQNKYMGDLLLAEDQLMYGAWNQRVKMTKSNKEKQSIFGADIAATVGCHKDLTKRSDIKVGFGRKNPNATKFGRERRGKKKKATDKACGLKRY